MKNILITGASGFLGSHVLSLLIEKGYRPLVYLREHSDRWRIQHLQGRFTTFIAEDNSSEVINRLFDEHSIEAVIHIATDYGRKRALSDVIEANVLFPLRLIERGAEKGVKLFINTDTFFGKKQFSQQYLNGYVITKRMLEGLLADLSLTLKIVNLRLEHVYGENDSEQKFFTNFVKQLILNQKQILLTEGLQKRDFVYVADVACAYIQILEEEALLNSYQEFEVGTGQSITVRQFVVMISELISNGAALQFGAIPLRDGEIENSFANTGPLNKLGWAVRYDMNTALERILKIEKKRFKDEV